MTALRIPLPDLTLVAQRLWVLLATFGASLGWVARDLDRIEASLRAVEQAAREAYLAAARALLRDGPPALRPQPRAHAVRPRDPEAPQPCLLPLRRPGLAIPLAPEARRARPRITGPRPARQRDNANLASLSRRERGRTRRRLILARRAQRLARRAHAVERVIAASPQRQRARVLRLARRLAPPPPSAVTLVRLVRAPIVRVGASLGRSPPASPPAPAGAGPRLRRLE